MPPQTWVGTNIPEHIKALILQLDPGDDEAEREIRQVIERQTRRNLQAAMDDILSDITAHEPISVDETVLQTRGYFQRDQAVYDALGRALQDGVDLGVSVAVEQFETIGFGMDWTLVNTRARDWARDYVGDLIRNVEQTTIDSVRQSVSRWIGNSEPLQALIDDLAPTFGAQRAELIASTEVTRAFAQGNTVAYKESGVVEQIEWRTARDERVCPICGPLHGQHTALGQTFGGIYPPAHPRCRCWTVAVIEEPKEITKPKPEPEKLVPPTNVIVEFEGRSTQKQLRELEKVPKALQDEVAKKNVSIYLGKGGVPNIDDMGELAGVPVAAGGRVKYTWDSVGGAYNSAKKRVIIGTKPSSSVSATLHEYGHAIGDVLGYDDSPRLIAAHERAFPKLDRYLQQKGPGDRLGRREFFAEAFAQTLTSAQRARKLYGDEIVDFITTDVIGRYK